MPRIQWTLLLLVAGVSACASTQAPYVAPRTLDVDPATYDESRLIPYRILTRGDFKAARAPAGMDGESVGAVTAALIRTSRVTIATMADTGSELFVATVDGLRFEARMSQNHSWWNPGHAVTENELLEHEQTHFAFSELAVRRANAEIESIKSRIRSVAKTPEDAIRLAAGRLQCEVDRMQSDVNARNGQFDRETLNGRRCELNRTWLEQVQHELARSKSSVDISASRASLPLPRDF